MTLSRTHLEVVPDDAILLFAAPGIGNVGKLVIDGLIQQFKPPIVFSVTDPDLPPHAMKDEHDSLRCPALRVHLVSGEKSFLVATCQAQPMSPSGQHRLALALRQEAKEWGVKGILVLVGMSAEPSDHDVLLLGPSSEDREWLKNIGATPSERWPEAGMIGMAAWMATLGEIDGIPTACIVASSVGGTVDLEGARRLHEQIEKMFDVDLPIERSTEKSLAERVEQLIEVLDGSEEVSSASSAPQIDLYQ
ncbi:MAG TPA: PAC2 family protein [Candidatus Poseidoniales archaeon]|nr:PAC2 family protein [Candidatus Poseidoniales archaeon]